MKSNGWSSWYRTIRSRPETCPCRTATAPPPVPRFTQAKAQYEKEFILSKLKRENWNVSQTARLLGLERSYLYRKMKTYGIEK